MKSMKSDTENQITEQESNPYGYGLTLHLNADQCEALNIKTPLRAGSQVKISALARVKTITESMENEGDDVGNDISLCLQITDMELDGFEQKSAAQTLYGSGVHD